MPDGEKKCRNCGADLNGAYCAACGQHDREFNKPLWELLREFGEEFFSVDERFVRSMTPLLFHPGRLTMEYLAGRRKSYISPFKMYFFVSCIFFFTGSWTDSEREIARPGAVTGADSTAVAADGENAFTRDRSPKGDIQITFTDTAQAESLIGRPMIDSLRKMKADPKTLFEKMKEHRPKFFFLLLPVFALLLKLLYIRSNILYIRHLVYAFYFHSFVFFILWIADLLKMTGAPWSGSASLIIYGVVPVHLFYGMKKIYGQGMWKTTVKFAMLTCAYAVLFFLAILAAALILITMFY